MSSDTQKLETIIDAAEELSETKDHWHIGDGEAVRSLANVVAHLARIVHRMAEDAGR